MSLHTPPLFLALSLALGCATASCRDLRHTTATRSAPSATPSPPTLSEAPLPNETPPLTETFDGPVDPAGPPGDLAAELATFTTLEACVLHHRPTDPLLSDTLEALGYDRFARDSCRTIEALKRRDAAPCSAMLSSALRHHCEWGLAIYLGDPSRCPLDLVTAGVSAHDPTCLAAAAHDVRPCAALRKTERAACEGLVAHDPARCGTDARCTRRVSRWRNVLPQATGRAPYQARIVVTLASTDPSAATSAPTDLPDEAAAGAIVTRTSSGTVRVVVGEVRAVALAAAEHGTTSGGFLIDLPAALLNGGDLSLAEPAVQVWWRSPFGFATLSPGEPAHVHITRIATEQYGPVTLDLSTTIGPPSARRTLQWQVDTWARDVILADQASPHAKGATP